MIDVLYNYLNENFYGKAEYNTDSNSGCLAWQYVFLEETESPDFKNPNAAFYRLLDKDYFERFTSKCAETMIELLKK